MSPRGGKRNGGEAMRHGLVGHEEILIFTDFSAGLEEVSV